MLSDVALLKFKVVGGLVLLVALAMGVLWYGEWRADEEVAIVSARYDKAIDQLKIKAAKELGAETANVLRLERELATAQANLEVMSHERETITAGYERRLAALGRLRDPNATGCGGGGGSAQGTTPSVASQGTGDAAEAGGFLSVELDSLLRSLVRDADEVNDAYAVCRADAVNLRQAMQLSPPEIVDASH